MTIVRIENLVWFAPNYGVYVERDALAEDPKRLQELLALAWEHMENPLFQEACHGGSGPLAGHSEITFEEYLRICEAHRILERTTVVKRKLTRVRRSEWNAIRAHTVLAMIDRGIPYVCATDDCGETTDLTVDHKLAISRGGTDEFENLCFMCRSHNSRKHDL